MLEVIQDGSILRITLNRPEVRNALSDEVIQELSAAFNTIPTEVRVVILTGAGSAFCAGGDLEWMRRAAAYTEDQNKADALKLAHLFESIAQCRPVVIARVNGHSFGGGAGLVAACDVGIAAEGALFSFSEAKLGLVPATISTYVIPKIGAGNARWLFSTAEVFGAKEAKRVGLVHKAVSPEELDAAVDQVVNNVLSAGPEAAHHSKMLAQGEPLSPEAGAALLAQVRAGAEAKEGVDAFLSKRAASFVEKR